MGNHTEILIEEYLTVYNSTLGIVATIFGAIVSSLVVGIVLRLIYRNPEVRPVANAVVIILGAFGVFCLLTVSPILLFSRLFGVLAWSVSILISLIIGLAATSGLKDPD